MMREMVRAVFLVLVAAMGVLDVDATSRGRSRAARAEFVRAKPCPATGLPRGACPGWVIDHVEALACGGADSPANMQWQTVADAKAKDKWERKGCERRVK